MTVVFYLTIEISGGAGLLGGALLGSALGGKHRSRIARCLAAAEIFHLQALTLLHVSMEEFVDLFIPWQEMIMMDSEGMAEVTVVTMEEVMVTMEVMEVVMEVVTDYGMCFSVFRIR
jgi:hypothetical protein